MKLIRDNTNNLDTGVTSEGVIIQPDRCYVLTRDVQNPRPDRRTSYDWIRAVTWEKGERFFTSALDGTVTLHKERPSNYIRPYIIDNPTTVNPQFSAIVEAAVERDDAIAKLYFVKAKYYTRPDEILQRLIDEGVVPMTEVERIAKAIYDQAE